MVIAIDRGWDLSGTEYTRVLNNSAAAAAARRRGLPVQQFQALGEFESVIETSLANLPLLEEICGCN